MERIDVAIVGAGPFGLSTAASLARRKTRVFGEPMLTWKTTMPRDMILRSAWSETSLATTGDAGSILAWAQREGVNTSGPLPLDAFLAYGEWFRGRFVPDLHRENVARVESHADGFVVSTEHDDEVRADAVVVAVGVTPFVHVPTPLAEIEDARITPPLDPASLRSLDGQRVLVLGGGQAALESAGIAARAGANVELVTRSTLHWFADREPYNPRSALAERIYRLAYPAVGYGPAPLNRIALHPDLFAALPRKLKRALARRVLRPGGSPWLRSLVEGHVRVSENLTISLVDVSPESLQITLSDGTRRVVDRVIAATGYRCNLARLGFLEPSLRKAIAMQEGWPILDRYFRSSVPNLFFIGYPAEGRFGPLSRFVLGTRFTVDRLERVLGDS